MRADHLHKECLFLMQHDLARPCSWNWELAMGLQLPDRGECWSFGGHLFDSISGVKFPRVPQKGEMEAEVCFREDISNCGTPKAGSKDRGSPSLGLGVDCPSSVMLQT